jgi:hypothetical protein
VIRLVREYCAEFRDTMRATWLELRAERNWFGLGVLVLLMPIIFVSTLLAAVGDRLTGPE